MFAQHEKDEKPCVSAYMDGVLVKISERYKPPRKLTLPLSCQNCASPGILTEEYDFKLERTVLSKMSEWRRARKWKRDETDRRKESREAAKTESNAPSKPPPQSEVILTPLLTALPPPAPPAPLPPQLDLAAFESDNSSPFDNMELKTINEMEILASVLGGKNGSNGYNGYHWNGAYPFYNFSSQTQAPGQSQLSTQPNEGYRHVNHIGAVLDNKPGYSDLIHRSLFEPSAHGAGYVNNNTSRSRYVSETSQERASDVTATSTTGTYSNSRSVPDIVQELERELKERVKVDEHVTKPRVHHVDRGKVKSQQHVALPDPTNELSGLELKLANQMVEMGFTLSRAARAVKRYQGDDKKAIEFLLQVQSLAERRESASDEDLCELVLAMSDSDEPRATELLAAADWLSDLGFPQCRVLEALQSAGGDREKALDALVS